MVSFWSPGLIRQLVCQTCPGDYSWSLYALLFRCFAFGQCRGELRQVCGCPPLRWTVNGHLPCKVLASRRFHLGILRGSHSHWRFLSSAALDTSWLLISPATIGGHRASISVGLCFIDSSWGHFPREAWSFRGWTFASWSFESSCDKQERSYFRLLNTTVLFRSDWAFWKTWWARLTFRGTTRSSAPSSAWSGWSTHLCRRIWWAD